MAWPSTRATNYVVTATDWNEIVNDLATWAGNVNGGGFNLSNVGTVTATTFSGSGASLTSIPNAALVNSSVTVNGSAISLGGSATITANTTNALTIGAGLSGTSFNGSGAVTIAIDSTVALRADAHYIGTTAVALNRASANLALTGISSVQLPGATSGTVTLQPASVAGTTTITLPATTGTVVTTGDTGTVTNTMLSGSIANAKLANSSVTVNGQSVSLGGSTTVTATATNALTIGSGLSGTSYNGSTPITIAVDSTVALRADTTFIGTTSVALNRASANLALTGISSVTLPGATSGTIVLQPIAVAGSNTITLPAVTGTVITTADTGTVTNTMLAGSIANAKLSNSSVTVNGSAVSLGGSITVTATATNALTIGTGLTGTSYNGSSPVTIAVDTSVVAQKSDTTFIGTTSVALNRASANLNLTGILSVTLPGATSGSVQVIPAAVAGTSTVFTLPATTGTAITTGDTGTVTNTMLAGSIANAKLSNSSVTVNGQSVSLGGSTTITANTTNALTIGSGLSGTSFNGSGAVTIAVDSTVALRADTTFIGTTSVALNRASANLALTGISSVTLPGATSGSVQLIPNAVAGTGIVLTLPANTGTLVTTGDTGTVTNTMLAGSIANAKLANSSVTVNGNAVSLGGSTTITANTTNALTIGTGLSGSSFNGSGAVTIAIDSTVVTLSGSQTLTNKTLTTPAIGSGGFTIAGATSGTTTLVATATASGTLTLPAATDTLVGKATTDTLTNKTISGASNTLSNIGNGSLTNSSVTINGSSVSLGGSISVTANTTNALTIGTGLSGTSFNGSGAVTIAIDSTVVTLSGSQTLTNKTLTTPAIGSGGFTIAGATSGTTTLVATAVASGTLTLPAATDTLVGKATTDTLTNKTISGASNTLSNIGNGSLTNSSVTVNGQSVSLGGSTTITANTTNALTIGSGLSGTSFNGSGAVTIAVDSTVALRADTHYIGTTAVTLNRASANLNLTGILSVTLPGATSGSVQIIPAAVAGTGTVFTLPATTGTAITSGDTGTVTNTMLAGSIANAKLSNSSVTVNGNAVSLGGSTTITANTTNTLTIGTGLSGTSFNGSAPITIAIDSTVATLTGSQTLTNKTISGASNTLSNIGNSSLTNSSITINGQSVSLGGSVSISSTMAVLSKTANYTVTTGDGADVLVKCSASGGAFAITLYTAVGNTGNRVTVKKTDSSANAVTINTTSSQTIDGDTSRAISTQWTSLTLVSDGSNWMVI